MSNSDDKDSLAICQTTQGVEFRAGLLGLPATWRSWRFMIPPW